MNEIEKAIQIASSMANISTLNVKHILTLIDNANEHKKPDIDFTTGQMFVYGVYLGALRVLNEASE